MTILRGGNPVQSKEANQEAVRVAFHVVVVPVRPQEPHASLTNLQSMILQSIGLFPVPQAVIKVFQIIAQILSGQISHTMLKVSA
jgi:hypothetical protein